MGSKVALFFPADDWRLMIQSAETASSGASVVVYVYGWTTNSGRIELGPTGSLFQANNRDEFKVNLKDLGELIKIRVELEPSDFNAELPTWRLQEVRRTFVARKVVTEILRSVMEREKEQPMIFVAMKSYYTCRYRESGERKKYIKSWEFPILGKKTASVSSKLTREKRFKIRNIEMKDKLSDVY